MWWYKFDMQKELCCPSFVPISTISEQAIKKAKWEKFIYKKLIFVILKAHCGVQIPFVVTSPLVLIESSLGLRGQT